MGKQSLDCHATTYSIRRSEDSVCEFGDELWGGGVIRGGRVKNVVGKQNIFA
jgi:hypothetical protein